MKTSRMRVKKLQKIEEKEEKRFFYLGEICPESGEKFREGARKVWEVKINVISCQYGHTYFPSNIPHSLPSSLDGSHISHTYFLPLYYRT